MPLPQKLTLYHGTCPGSAKSLVENGWQPFSGMQGANMGYQGYLYLTDDPDDARWFAEQKGCKTVVVVRDVPIEYLIVDPDDAVTENVQEEYELSRTYKLPLKLALIKALPAEHFSVLNEKTAKLDIDLGGVQSIVTEMMPLLTSGLERPKIVVQNNTNSRWLGRCAWHPDDPATTTIQLQKSLLGDEQSLHRVIAHELCHHEWFLLFWANASRQQRNILEKIEGGHGRRWKDIANRFNQKYGADFVTEKSDESYVISDTDKEFYVLLWRNSPQSVYWAYAVNPSTKPRERKYRQPRMTQKEFIDQKLTNPNYRLIKSRDRTLLGAVIGKGWGVPRTQEMRDKLNRLFDEAPVQKLASKSKYVFHTKGTNSKWDRLKHDFFSGIVYHGTTLEIAQIIQKDGFRGLEFDAILDEVLAKYGQTRQDLTEAQNKQLLHLSNGYSTEHHLVSTSPSGEAAARFAGQGGEVPFAVERIINGNYMLNLKDSQRKPSIIGGEPAVVKARIKGFQSTEFFIRTKEWIEGWENNLIGKKSQTSGHTYNEEEAFHHLWHQYTNFTCRPEQLEVLGVITGEQVEELKQAPLGLNAKSAKIVKEAAVLTPLEQERDAKFNELADEQRGAPEIIMVRCGMHKLGPGVHSYVLEHCGDLTNRTAQHFSDFKGQYDNVYDKVTKVLRKLESDYGFEREMQQNLHNNYDFCQKERGEKRPYEEVEAELFRLWDAYSDAHNRLTVYNDVQRTARTAAVCLGRRDFSGTIKALHELKDLMDSGQDNYIAKAGEYTSGKVASHKTPALADDQPYPEGSNGWALNEERREDNAETIPLEILSPETFKTASILSGFPDWQQFLNRFGGIKKLVQSYDSFEQFSDSMGWEPWFNEEQFNAATPTQQSEMVYEHAEAELEARFKDLEAKHQNWQWPLSVYRGISLNRITDVNLSKLGVYWAWDEHAAEAHWGLSGVGTYVFRALITERDVDWMQTMFANLWPSLGEEEKEIRLKEGVSPKITGWKASDDVQWQKPLREWSQQAIAASVGKTGAEYSGFSDPNHGWLFGRCHTYTVALSTLTGFPPYEVTEKEENGDFTIHSCVMMPDKTLLDASGKTTLRYMQELYKRPKLFLKPTTVEKLEKYAYHDFTFKAAMDDAAEQLRCLHIKTTPYKWDERYLEGGELDNGDDWYFLKKEDQKTAAPATAPAKQAIPQPLLSRGFQPKTFDGKKGYEIKKERWWYRVYQDGEDWVMLLGERGSPYEVYDKIPSLGRLLSNFDTMESPKTKAQDARNGASWTLQNYAENTHYHINSFLRGVKGFVKEDIQPMVDSLDKAFAVDGAHDVTKEPTEVYRFIDSSTVFDRFARGKDSDWVGKIITDKGFVSTSRNKDLIEKVVYRGHKVVWLHIQLPKGTKYLAINWKSERESLLARGSQFKILKRKRWGNVVELYVKLIVNKKTASKPERVPIEPQPKVIYHVSEASREDSIQQHGLDSTLSKERWNPEDGKGFYAFTDYMDAYGLHRPDFDRRHTKRRTIANLGSKTDLPGIGG
jgi:hypothetical protein